MEPEQARLSFNAYSHFLTGNPLVKLISYVLYTSIIGLAVFDLLITAKKKNGRRNL
jgi:succinate dehydrogenase / fumarate reductase cytochrome b subunit